MLRLFLYCFIVLFANCSSADLSCAYKCDAKKGKYDATQYIQSGSIPQCLVNCSYNISTAYYCEFFNSIGQDKSFNIKDLAKKLIETPREKSTQVAGNNNKLYALLRNFNTQRCVQHIQLMSLNQKGDSSRQLQSRFNTTLKLFKDYFERQFPEFKDYKHLCKNKSLDFSKPSFAENPGLFDWCYNYCSKRKVAKTSKAIETFVKRNKDLNAADLIDLIKTNNLKFSKSRTKYISRFYKCLSECPIEKTENYVCYFIDNIDIENKASDITRKILNLTA